jgi:hypothetical protein
MTLVYTGGTYEPTEADRLWLLRAVQAEGAPQLSVARALVNCFCLLRSRKRSVASLEEHVRAYAQPVNPRWFVDGDLFKLSLAAKQHEARAEAIRTAERREHQHSTRTLFSLQTTDAVELALSTEYEADVTDYAAYYVDATGKGMVARSGAYAGLNRLWTRAPGWRGYTVSNARNIA